MFNKKSSEIKTVKDFAEASQKEKEEKLKELERMRNPQLNINHLIDFDLTNQSLNNGNKLQSENDQQYPC
jgi:hypothetical protein